MPKDAPGSPTTRRYSPAEKAHAGRGCLRAKLATDHATVQRVAAQPGQGTE